MKSLVIKLPKKLSREAAARLGSERVAPGQAVPLHPEAVAFAGHYGFDIDVLAAYPAHREGPGRAAGFEPAASSLRLKPSRHADCQDCGVLAGVQPTRGLFALRLVPTGEEWRRRRR